ncbi:neoxanthin synthase, chloroplastic-like [Cicer arietinum]|uniref:Neoxanthin synthase, chloroplastic-like n=1 Tax=Cicer arietinum TaxID=3827 RepID=A0A1S2XFG4_CICAR|nr:neoxanthin synthase, chloroplastic-like [Cicer arietinum]
MGTRLMLISPPPPTKTHNQFTPSIIPLLKTHQTISLPTSRKTSSKIQSTSKFGNFLDLKPEYQPESLDFDLPWFQPSDRSHFDVIIIGAGPAGIRLAEQVSLYGIKVCCVDPDPLSIWPNNYGVWLDEFEGLGLQDCLDKTWPMASIYIDDNNTKYLDRSYGRVNRRKLKEKLVKACIFNGVQFYKAKVWEIKHHEFESFVVCDNGTKLKGSLVVDASGFGSNFIEYDDHKVRNYGCQIAHGVLVEVDTHPFDLDKMVLMDWRDSHLGNEPYLRNVNSKVPTFLYAMPFSSNLIFLEETSLVSRPVLSYMEVKRRMVARLRHLGIRVKRVLEDEKCLIPMGGPLPRIPQNVMAFGGNCGVVHPSSGYMVARTMALAPIVAASINECLGSTRMIRGKQLYAKVWNSMWPIERRFVRECYSFGMETLLKLDLNETRHFFDAFFDLKPYYWQGFLSSRLNLKDFALLSISLFGHASNSSRFDIVTKCPVPFAKMMGNMALESIR